MLLGVRCDPAEFRALPLEAHAILADVPLRDVSVIDLPGGGPDRTLLEVRDLLPGVPGSGGNLATRALFAIRWSLGRALGWDRPQPAEKVARWSYVRRLPEGLVARSLVPPGQADGPFRILYALDRETLAEIHNATAHGFLVSALTPRPGGYRLYWAVYVRPVSWLTPLYMVTIEPFRRLIVYPSLLRHVRRAWSARYGPSLEEER
jgi:hypothetical protein